MHYNVQSPTQVNQQLDNESPEKMKGKVENDHKSPKYVKLPPRIIKDVNKMYQYMKEFCYQIIRNVVV